MPLTEETRAAAQEIIARSPEGRSRSALGRMVTEDEVGAAVVAMLAMPGMCGADIDLSAGMVA